MDPMLLIVLALAVGAMFLMTNRSRKQQRAAQDLLASLAPGQEVMTRSGMFGTVVEVDDDKNTVTLESPSGSRTVWLRAAIGKVVEPPVSDETEEPQDATIASDQVDEDDETVVDFAVPDDLSSLSDQGVDFDKDSGADPNKRRETGDEDTK